MTPEERKKEAEKRKKEITVQRNRKMSELSAGIDKLNGLLKKIIVEAQKLEMEFTAQEELRNAKLKRRELIGQQLTESIFDSKMKLKKANEVILKTKDEIVSTKKELNLLEALDILKTIIEPLF